MATRGLHGLFHFVGQTLAIGRAVVDDGDLLGLQVLHHELADRRTLLGVAGHHAERGFVALLGVFRRRRHGDLGQTGFMVDTRRGDGGARVEVAQDAHDVLVNQLLRHLHAHARIGLVITRHQHELGRLAVYLDALLVGFFQSQVQPVLHVFTVVRLRTGQRGGKAEFDVGGRCGGRHAHSSDAGGE
ncbi:hypothetical protein D3C72_1062130 [compost metagenome]